MAAQSSGRGLVAGRGGVGHTALGLSLRWRVAGTRAGGGGVLVGRTSMDWGTELWVSPLPPAPTVLPCWGPGLSALCPRCTFAGTPRFPLQLIPWVPALCPQHSLSKVPFGLSRCPEGLRDTLPRAGLGKLRHRVENEAITRSSWTRPGRGGQLGEVTYFERSGLAWRLILRPLGPCPSLAFPAGRGRVPFGHLLSHVGPHPVDFPHRPALAIALKGLGL